MGRLGSGGSAGGRAGERWFSRWEHSLCKLEALSLDPQHPQKKLGLSTYASGPSADRRCRQLACWGLQATGLVGEQ